MRSALKAAQADSDTATRILEFDLVTLRRAPKIRFSGIGRTMQIQSVGKLTQLKLTLCPLTARRGGFRLHRAEEIGMPPAQLF